MTEQFDEVRVRRQALRRGDTGTDEPLTLLTAVEVGAILRTSRAAIYAMVARGQLPGVTRIGRRILVRRDALLDWLDWKSARSPKELRR